MRGFVQEFFNVLRDWLDLDNSSTTQNNAIDFQQK